MSAGEDDFVRFLARDRSTSLNDVICGFIRKAMLTDEAPPPTPPPRADPPQAAAPKKRRQLRDPQKPRTRHNLKLTFSDLIDPEPIPGQTSITDPDQ